MECLGYAAMIQRQVSRQRDKARKLTKQQLLDAYCEMQIALQCIVDTRVDPDGSTEERLGYCWDRAFGVLQGLGRFTNYT